MAKTYTRDDFRDDPQTWVSWRGKSGRSLLHHDRGEKTACGLTPGPNVKRESLSHKQVSGGATCSKCWFLSDPYKTSREG